MPDKRIIEFIKHHHLLTLATSKDNTPYCCNIFYVYNEKNNSLIFSSETKTKHVQDFIENPEVSGTIALETKDVEKIQGVQLLGRIIEPKGEEIDNATAQYLKEFPYAKKMRLYLWEMRLTFIKMTHNKLCFGKKLIWQKKVK
ncbi:pyridoxamine 5'-phosphate oxidase family protein [Flavobacteriales bacterium]|nr:pyridoxamine 5'-phosphate oxidase family protein [Flavobacteriales bacterium]